jgi:hypothetical protein
MTKLAFPAALLALALMAPLGAHADTIDDFVITGGSYAITFSLPASPTGNNSTCPVGNFACLPGSETAFYLNAPATINGVTSNAAFAFPTFRFIGGLSISPTPPFPGRLFGPQLFAPDAGDPTFLLGTYSLAGNDPSGALPFINYTLTITQETRSAATPEPSSLALFSTGILGLIGFTRSRFRHFRATT